VVHFQRARLFFQNILRVDFFFIFPCSNFIFFPKIVGERGEVVKIFFQDVKIFSGHKKRGQNNFFRTNISLVKV
jgi:hypothetical protein